MNSNNNIILLAASWLNVFIGSLKIEPILSTTAYLLSIIGSIVYIYKTLKNKNHEKTN